MRALIVALLTASLSTVAAPPVRDPFQPPKVIKPVSAICNTVLCRHDLADLTLVAIVSGDSEPMAMFENRDGKGFVARRNTQVGSSGARITKIARECVTLTRYVSGADGRAQPVVENLCLEGAAQPGDYDYLQDGPYTAP